ncbi:MAG: peptide chain release factor N(5)-glutamine methyltransferase [Acidiferrobacterales bacterium]
MQPNIKLTLGDVLVQVTSQLAESPTARLDAEVLTAFVCQLSREQLITLDQSTITDQQQHELQQLIFRRQQGEPIAYLTGKREFYSLDLTVNEKTLIPRPETELLVELVLEQIPPVNRGSPFTIVDLGTGSGAIALAIAKQRPDCQLVATDNSKAALQVATENAKQHAIRNIEFRLGHWYEALTKNSAHIIVSNPPYVAAGDVHLSRGDVRYEPQTALVAGTDGLDDIRLISGKAKEYLLPGGLLVLEHGAEQAQKVRALLIAAGADNIICHQDLAGLDRVSTCIFTDK